MNCHVPWAIIQPTPLNPRERYLWVLTVRECRLGCASASSLTFFDKSQSIKIPVPFSVMRIFPALTSRCKIRVLLYVSVCAITIVNFRNGGREAFLTDDNVSNHFTQLPSRFESVQRHPNSLENQSIVNIWFNHRTTRAP